MDLDTLAPEVQRFIKDISEENKLWEIKYTELKEKYDLVVFRKFGRSTESLQINNGQPSLFSEESETSAVQNTGDEQPSESANEAQKIGSYTRAKAGRKPLDEKLPRTEVIIDIPEEDKLCACGTELVRIGEEVSERLQVIPPRIYVERIIRPKYACRNCEGSSDEDKPAVRVSPSPASIIPGSIVTPGLLAFIITNKYVDHLPFYRQEKKFERIDISISRQNMSNWQQQVYKKLEPLFDLLKCHVKSGPVMQMDETPVQVMGESEREDTQQSYMWLARGGPPEKPAIMYEYRETRAAKHIHDFLTGFTGYLQTDGYEGYNSALKSYPGIIHVGCFAHARRKFFEAAKVSKKAGSAEEGMKYIRKLYEVESDLRKKELTPDEFLAERKERSTPILEKFRAWLDNRALQVPPSLALGKAIHYTLGQWEKLIAYLESPYLTPDNNACENAIRPFVLGRKNWLFAGSPDGAKSSCGMYSLVETSRQNGLDPEKYLTHIFDRCPHAKNKADWEALLPWNVKEL